jgi:hypothetical protein
LLSPSFLASVLFIDISDLVAALDEKRFVTSLAKFVGGAISIHEVIGTRTQQRSSLIS